MSDRIPPNVRRGAEMLDERLPGWRDRVNPGRLKLDSECGCVLGQVLGGYSEGVKLLGLNDRDAERYGFWTRGRQSWDRLTEGWKALVSA